MTNLLGTKVAALQHDEILSLIRELEEVSRVGSRDFVNAPFLHFLTQCVYPEGATKRIPVTTKFAASAPLLESRVGKLPNGPLCDLCGELALLSGNALEFFSGSKVYMLLNKTLPKFSPQGPTEKQRRWDAVIRQRRSNRA